MNHYGQLIMKGPLHLFFKSNQLFFQPGFIPVKIDSNLAHSNEPAGSFQICGNDFKLFFIGLVHGGRVQSDHRKAKVPIGITNRQHGFNRRTIYVRHKDMRHTGSTGTFHNER